MDKIYQIFVSSADESLKEEIRIVKETILAMHHFPIVMELKNEEQWKRTRDDIQSSDYYALIIGHKYGSVVGEGEYAGISYAQRAFRYAFEQEIPILLFLIDSNVYVLPEKIEQDAAKKKKLEQFIEEVKKGSTVQWWTSKDDLANKVFIALNKGINKEKGLEQVKK